MTPFRSEAGAVDIVQGARDRLDEISRAMSALADEQQELETFFRVVNRLAAECVEARREGNSGVATSKPPVEEQEPPRGDDVATILTVANEKAAAATPVAEVAVSPAPMPPTLKQLVGPLMDEHPDWTAAQIADAIDRPRASVAATMSVLRRERSSEAPKQAPPEPLAQVPEPVREVVRKPIAYPKGSRFYLLDEAGNYLHESVQVGGDGKPLMTSGKDWAWRGTEQQLVAVRRELPGTMDMRVEPIVEQQAARAA